MRFHPQFESLEDRRLLSATNPVLPQLPALVTDTVGRTLFAVRDQSFSAALGLFRTDDPVGLHATIDWGEGQPSPGTIMPLTPNHYAVGGTHSYHSFETFTIKVEISRDNQLAVTITSTVVVQAALSGSVAVYAGYLDYVFRAAGGLPGSIVLAGSPLPTSGSTVPTPAGGGGGFSPPPTTGTTDSAPAGVPWQRTPDHEPPRPDIRGVLLAQPGPTAAASIAAAAPLPNVTVTSQWFVQGRATEGSTSQLSIGVRSRVTVRVPLPATGEAPAATTLVAGVNASDTGILPAHADAVFASEEAEDGAHGEPWATGDEYLLRLRFLQEAGQSHGLLTCADPALPPAEDAVIPVNEPPATSWTWRLSVAWLLVQSLVHVAWERQSFSGKPKVTAL